MTATGFTYDEVKEALATTEQRIHQASGDDGVDDVFFPIRERVLSGLAAAAQSGPRFSRDIIEGLLNAAADAVSEADYEDSEVIWTQDVANLTVNCAAWLLDHPGADLDEIIPAQYTDVEPDFCDLPEEAPEPEQGSPEWNAGVTTAVLGWVA
jgi:hypothetical protein